MLVAMGDNAVKCQFFDMLPQLHCPLLLSIPPYRHTAILPQNAVAHKVAMWRTWRGAVAAMWRSWRGAVADVAWRCVDMNVALCT